MRRIVWYEPALRLHQLGAVVLAYTTLRHVGSRWWIYALAPGVYLATSTIVQLSMILYRQPMRPCTATIRYDAGTTSICLRVPGHMPWVGGQYLNLWMPLSFGAMVPDLVRLEEKEEEQEVENEVEKEKEKEREEMKRFKGSVFDGFATWWQSHPFMPVRWEHVAGPDGGWTELDLVVVPHHGWTWRLHIAAKIHHFPNLILSKETSREQANLRRAVATRLPLESAQLLLASHETAQVSEISKHHKKLAKLEKRIRDFKPDRRVALYSGPHGRSISTDGFGHILVVAERFDIVYCMPYVRQILQEQNIAYKKYGKDELWPSSYRGSHETVDRFLLVHETTKAGKSPVISHFSHTNRSVEWYNSGIQRFKDDILEHDPTPTGSQVGSKVLPYEVKSYVLDKKKPVIVDKARKEDVKRAAIVEKGPMLLGEELVDEHKRATAKECRLLILGKRTHLVCPQFCATEWWTG